MRKFIDPEGNFTLSIPNDWVLTNNMYESQNSVPYTFEFYEDSIGSFQISCNSVPKDQILEVTKDFFLTSQKKNMTKLNFREKQVFKDEFDTYIWMALVEDKLIMCTYTYESSLRGSNNINSEVNKARTCLESLIIIGEKYKSKFLASERFDKFMTSYAASVDLLQRAYKNGSAVEIIILLSNQIDALLRLLFILKKQIENNTNEIDTSLIHQKNTDKPILEKQVYKMALNEKLIDKSLYEKLNILYNERNKVVHQFIITDLLTRDVFNIAFDYSKIERVIGKIVKECEKKQYQAKVGIYGTELPPDHPLDNDEQIALINSLKEKHAHSVLNNEISFGKENGNLN